jgi:phage tail-like protein
MAETQTPDLPENELAPLHVFRFQVSFTRANLPGAQARAASDVPLCSGAFADCTGLEATMEPKVIKVGGSNYGPAQRVGPVTFATVVLKRGMTSTRDLWNWFQMVAGGSYSYRLDARITVQSTSGEPVLTWVLERALPVKFKAADLNAKGADIGIEELHLAHEGLRFEKPAEPPRAR